MGTTVQNVLEWNWQNEFTFLGIGNVGNVFVQWNALSSSGSIGSNQRNTKIALAPNLDLFGVPSKDNKNSSILAWSTTSILAFIKAGAMMSLTLATAFKTPLPNHLDLSPSLNSKASWTPVEAPDGTIDLNKPLSVVKSTSTVGLPLES